MPTLTTSNPQPCEEELNPAPYKYRVSSSVKTYFFILLALSFAGYFYMIFERRSLQNTYISENHMAAVTWNNTMLPSFVVREPQSGKELVLRSNEGQWTLLNLWATWCVSCRLEMPSLELLQQSLGDTLKIVALSLDDNNDAVIDFIKTNNPSFRVLIDHEKQSIKHLGIDKYPETFLIAPDGRIKLQFSGPRQWASAETIAYLKRQLN